jgi:hypothetical protein
VNRILLQRSEKLEFRLPNRNNMRAIVKSAITSPPQSVLDIRHAHTGVWKQRDGTGMGWTAVSGSGNGHSNEDLVRVLEHGVTDVLLLDGATSLAERDYVDAVGGGPAWFVRMFADAFTAPLGSDDQEAIVPVALISRPASPAR